MRQLHASDSHGVERRREVVVRPDGSKVIRVEKRYVPVGSRVLIIDDFLADGQAVHGMTDLCSQLGAKVVGIGVAVEKGFQKGGKALRAQGIHLKSLAIVTGIEDGKIQLADD